MMRYEYKIRVTVASTPGSKESRIRVGVVCHKCMQVVYTIQVLVSDEYFGVLASESCVNAMKGHQCDPELSKQWNEVEGRRDGYVYDGD